jgi:hypothetical protein
VNEEYVTASYIAKVCGVTNAAVSNWIARGVLPVTLRPKTMAATGQSAVWLWTLGQADWIVAWDLERQRDREEKRKK